jgi:hypothetical protein
MPRLKQKRNTIQYGGTKVSVRESKDNSSFTPCYEEEKIGKSLLSNTKSIHLITDSSIGSCLFYGELNDDSLVLLESQTIAKDKKSPIPFLDAKHVLENVGKGMTYQRFCMKVMLFDPINTDGKISSIEYMYEKRFKEITNNLTVKKEKEKQKKIYETSICVSGTDGEIVADGIASIVLTPLEFETFFKAKMLSAKEKDVFYWIFKTASENNLQVCVYFMDYLDGFITLHNFLKMEDRQGITIYQVSNDIAAYILYILYITKEWSYDMHNGNIMILIKSLIKKYMLRFIDFGRTINFGDVGDNDYIRKTFEKFLNKLHDELTTLKKMTVKKDKDRKYEKMLLHDLYYLHLFFHVIPPRLTETEPLYDQTSYKEILTQKFNEYHEKLSLFDLTLLHDDTKTQHECIGYLFECLMFLSFIELIILYTEYGQDTLQCSIMGNTFMMSKINISTFLENNRLKYDSYLSKNKDAIKIQIGRNFSSIYNKLKELTSRCSILSTQDLRGETRINAIEQSTSLLKHLTESAVDASEKEKQKKEEYDKRQEDYERYYQTRLQSTKYVKGGSTRKRKYSSRRFHNRRKSRKYRSRQTTK